MIKSRAITIRLVQTSKPWYVRNSRIVTFRLIEARYGFIRKATHSTPTFVNGQLPFGADQGKFLFAAMLNDETLNDFKSLP